MIHIINYLFIIIIKVKKVFGKNQKILMEVKKKYNLLLKKEKNILKRNPKTKVKLVNGNLFKEKNLFLELRKIYCKMKKTMKKILLLKMKKILLKKILRKIIF